MYQTPYDKYLPVNKRVTIVYEKLSLGTI